MVKSIFDRSYVAAKQMTWIWRAVTKIERKFYHPKFGDLLEANRLVMANRLQEAEILLNGKFPKYLRSGIPIVRANMSYGNSDAWLLNVNQYLEEFDQDQISLINGPSRFKSLTAFRENHVEGGPLISVIMPVHNAGETVAFAMKSILGQTWRNIELVVVDDASSDNSWTEIQAVAAQDNRTRILRLEHNVGPYVCKNIAVYKGLVSGSYITCHDADDWAHPQRLEKHIKLARERKCLDTASLAYCLRMLSDGLFTRISEPRTASPDGITQVARVSCLFGREFLLHSLGSWDCVKFGADSEIISRTEKIIGRRVPVLGTVAMICLDSDTNLSRHKGWGVFSSRRLSPARKAYKQSYEKWHASSKHELMLEFPSSRRAFKSPEAMMVDDEAITSSLTH